MSTFGFDTEEKVLSYHGPLLYEASVIDRTVRQAPDGVTKIKLYLLHYSGWNSHWDEWVPQSRCARRSRARARRGAAPNHSRTAAPPSPLPLPSQHRQVLQGRAGSGEGARAPVQSRAQLGEAQGEGGGGGASGEAAR